ncbi:MAG TPA: hypothetical protein VEK79_22310 [Thermoanaerobaculia bacterium]|nr:hypothetical protein [Thermoanaerobaculia bacterium]
MIRIPVAARLLAVCFLVIAVSADARVRAVRKTPALLPTTPQCHTFALVKAGTKATYLSTTPTGSANYTITWLSDTPTRTQTTQVVSTPQGNANAVTTIDGEVVGLLRGMKHIDVKTTITVPIVGTLTTEVDIDFVPSLILGPAAGWCAGNKWSVAPVTETITTKAPLVQPVTAIVTTIGGDGEVLAVGESVTVPAGTFRTVKYRGVTVANNTVQHSITWTSMDHSIVVKQEATDPATGAILTATVLTNLVSPASILQRPATEDSSNVESGAH